MTKKTRTKEETEELRLLAYDFLLLRSIGKTGERVLRERGYSSPCKKAFIQKHRVGHDYFRQLRSRKEFKQSFFDHITTRKAEDLGYLVDALAQKDPLKALQIIFPQQVNKLLVSRNYNVNQTVNRDEDDPEFTRKFFGLSDNFEEQMWYAANRDRLERELEALARGVPAAHGEAGSPAVDIDKTT